MIQRWLLVAIALLPLVGPTGCRTSAHSARPVRVGSKAFTESVLLGEILRLLALSVGSQAEHRAQLGDTSKTWNGLLVGELDVYVEYTGTLTQEVLARERIRTPEQLDAVLAGYGLRMSRSLGFCNNYALGMRRSQAETRNIRTISDLVQHPDLRIGLSNAFLERADGWNALKAHYRLPFATPRSMEHSVAYQAILQGSLDVLDLYTTDAEILQGDLLVLEDDRRFFPRYEAVLLYRADLEDRLPKVVQTLKRLEGAIDEKTMQQLNNRALQKIPEAKVAADFLAEQLRVDVPVEADSLARRLWRMTGEHVFLVAVSLLAAIVLAIPLGVIAAHRPLIGQLLLALVGGIQTFPALALLSLLILLTNRIGTWPALIALCLYSLLPIVRNTSTGIRDISLNIRESAAALGFSAWDQLWLVELPLASRAILAGIKTAAVINVGFATLGGLIGAGGYGQAILSGLNKNDALLVLEGAIPAVSLALIVQGLFEIVERLVVPRGLRLKPAE